MNKKEVLELRKKQTKDKASFSRVCGCYVDSGKNKILTMGNTFLSLDDDEFYKYLDIAKKSLGGKLGNNLLNLEFPLEEEKPGGCQQMLMALRDSDLKNDELLNTFYDHVIDTYDNPGNYLILLYLDNYDIIKKGSDNASIDESEEVYRYLICSICPVELSKPALGYKKDENKIGSRVRDWIVGAPESAFLFPSFNDRSTDIHEALFFAKKPKELHEEFIQNGLGCKPVVPSEMKRGMFEQAVRYATDSDDELDRRMVGICMDIDEQAESLGKDLADFEITEDNFEKVLRDNDMSDAQAKKVRKACREIFDDGPVTAADIVDEKAVEKRSKELGYKELEAENERLREEIEKLKKELKDARQ